MDVLIFGILRYFGFFLAEIYFLMSGQLIAPLLDTQFLIKASPSFFYFS